MKQRFYKKMYLPFQQNNRKTGTNDVEYAHLNVNKNEIAGGIEFLLLNKSEIKELYT